MKTRAIVEICTGVCVALASAAGIAQPLSRPGNPFHSAYGAPLVYLRATVSLDEVTRAILGEPPGQGGIYRARNRAGAFAF